MLPKDKDNTITRLIPSQVATPSFFHQGQIFVDLPHPQMRLQQVAFPKESWPEIIDVNRTSRDSELSRFWLVVDLPLWKIWVRQLGWWHSQLNGKNVPNHQPGIFLSKMFQGLPMLSLVLAWDAWDELGMLQLLREDYSTVWRNNQITNIYWEKSIH